MRSGFKNLSKRRSNSIGSISVILRRYATRLPAPVVADGNYGSNAICLKDKYLAVKCSTFFTWSPAKLDVFDTTTMQHIFSATTNDTFDATRAYGVTSDVVMEKVDNALVIYYIDNNTSAMEAFKLAL